MKTKDILNVVYDQLDFKSGQLFDVASQPLRKIGQDDRLNKGEWLTAAKRAGAEKIFFVDNNPVVIFARCSRNEGDNINCFNRLWSLARPRILFLECDGDLPVRLCHHYPCGSQDSGENTPGGSQSLHVV